MTQQYYDPNAGQYGAPQGYPPQQPPYYPPQQPPYQPPAPQGYAPPNPYGQPQGYGYAPPAQPQAPQGAPGSLEEFFGQPNVGGGKGISWKGVPDGYRIRGVVARPITDGDVFQESDPVTKALKFWRDNRPKMAMQVPLKLQWLDQMQQQQYPDGEAKLYLRGQIQEEMTRAMAEAGVAPGTPPESGALVDVTLTHRKPGNNIAQNVFAIVYRSPGTWENGAAPQAVAPQQAPYQQQATAQYAAPVQAAPNPQQYAAAPLPQGQAQPQYGQQAYNPNPQGQPQTAPQYGQAPAGAASAGDPAANLQAPGTPGLPAGAYPNPQQAQPTPQQQYAGATGSAEYGAPPAQQPQYVQDQLPMQPQGQAPQGNPNPQQPPVQPGVQPSALDPGRQALLARLQGGQQAPAPQG